MFNIQINGRQFHYEAFGVDRVEQPPIVLVNSPSQPDRFSWHEVIPLLSQQYRVIVADCRDNDRAMAGAIAGDSKAFANAIAILVRKLGHHTAHIIAYGTGGIIGLDVLLEHPEVVHSAVFQDISGLVDAPSYSSIDLAQITCPVLVIQGSDGLSSLPASRARQFAEYLRQAELWLPELTGPNIHEEHPLLWVERVLDFCEKHLTDLAAPWAITIRGVIDLRKEPSNRAERISQALLGDAVQIIETHGDWAWIRMERDHYAGWVHMAAVEPTSYHSIEAYHAASNAKILAELLPAWEANEVPPLPPGAGRLTGKLPFGVPIMVEEWGEKTVLVRLPNQEHRHVERTGLLPKSNWPKADSPGIAFTLELFRRFVGIPYLWGGRSPFGFDCSGLAQTFLNFLGINCPRDADLQFRVGAPIDGDPLPGDLLFFGEVNNPDSQRYENISHVAISLGGAEIIHANGTDWGVFYNSLDARSPHYRAWLHDHLVGVRRFR